MERYQILLATGDLPDMIGFDSAPPNYEEFLIEGGLVHELTDLMNQYGQNYLNFRPAAVEFAKKFWSNGTGDLYFLPMRSTGPIYEGPVEWFISLNLRWDIYKEIGYPPINSLDDLLDVLYQMVQHYPETEDGRKTYGVTTFVDWGMQWQFSGLSMTWDGGMFDVPGWFTYFENNPGQPLRYANTLVEPDSPFWQQVEFLFKANQLGIFDTDGLVQGWDQMGEKVEAGSIMLIESLWNAGNFNSLNRDDALGYANILIPGMGVISRKPGHAWTGEIGLPENRIGITTNGDNPEAAVRFIDFLSTYEGGRLFHSGIQGQHWDYIDGVPQILPEIVQLRADGLIGVNEGQRNLGTGNFLEWFSPITRFELMPDGGFASLWNAENLMSEGLSPLELEYCNFYGVDYPTQIIQQMLDDGRVYNIWNKLDELAYAVFTPIIPEDLLVVEQRVLGQAQNLLSEAILASDPATFARMKEAAIEEFNASGINDVFAVYEQAWLDALASVADLR